MRSIVFAFAVVFAALCGIVPSPASAVTHGPYLDLKSTLTPPIDPPAAGIRITIHWPQDTYYYDAAINRIVKDRSELWIEVSFSASGVAPPRSVIALGYTTPLTSNRNLAGGDVEITTIYGNDPNPSSPTSLAITGFTSGDNSYVSDETVIGQSGTIYNAHYSASVLIRDLPAALPGYDLSPFTGSVDDRVYVFKTIVPFNDLWLVPEPASLSAIGMLAVAIRRRRA